MSVDLRLDGPIATITLNRPEKLNSIDLAMRVELQDVWRELATDSRIRVAVLTGAGERAFCTGTDLKGVPPPADAFATQAFGSPGGDHLLAGLDTDVPLIAAVNGYAFGGGFEIALACDIRLAAENAEFALTEARVGSIPGAGGTQRLPRIIGQSLAMQLLLTGDRLAAPDALRCGLVSEVLPAGELLPRAQALAERIARNAPLSVRAIKRLVRIGLQAPLPAAMELERMAFGLIRDTDDRAEGRRAFAEKRDPDFHGR
ncbi:enoyl-CoA hydratase-related protein [Acrocarpospora macrocephala]|uniref:enoyl-CoA hydratase n=1 Tax=Acrocarpospora macrocephala TaxID=150177 RepID=A0A5M3WWG5_9ACTN|nr:enoyl-CoA hydratase-related protein [Acrocarpospora macrocephala]GES13090.1 crotonase [Acrocarpospora macrocephala]